MTQPKAWFEGSLCGILAQTLMESMPFEQRLLRSLDLLATESPQAPHLPCMVMLVQFDAEAHVLCNQRGRQPSPDLRQRAFNVGRTLLDATQLPPALDYITDSSLDPQGSLQHYALLLHEEAHRLGLLLIVHEQLPVHEALQNQLRNIAGILSLAMAHEAQRRELEHAMREARRAAQFTSRFLANISHEIRTPMNGIIGMLDVLGSSDLQSSQREQLTVARRSADGLLSLLNDVLDFSRIDAGELRLEVIDFSPGEIAEEVCALMAERAHSKQIELSCLIGQSVPDAVVGDPNRVRQVLMNLVGNAVKFTEQGQVGLRVSAMSTEDQRQELCFEISDSGIGIAEEACASLFQPFIQADSSTNRKYGGTGLGLVISRELARHMDGDIQFESQVGVGSVFRFTLCAPMGVSSGRSDDSGQLLRAVRILAVDDHDINLRVLENYFKRWQVDSVLLNDPEQVFDALSHAERVGQPFELVVLDYQMPGTDGPMLAQRIRRDFTEIKLVLLTSVGLPTEEVSALFDRCLTKPIQRFQLYNVLSQLLNKKTQNAEPLPSHSAATIESSTIGSSSQLEGMVLMVEDNEINREVCGEMLSVIGVQTEVALNGREAVECHAKRPYDAILMDCQMPEMDGYTATRLIREHEQLTQQHTPIIALTANAMAGDRERCLAAGMDDYLAKPFSVDMLRTLLKRWMNADNKKTASPSAHSEKGLMHKSDLEPLPEFHPDAYLNLEKVNELRQLMGARFTVLIQKYENNTKTGIGELNELLAKQDCTSLQRVAHRLKGSSGNLGASVMQQLLAELEHAARDEDFNACQALLSKLSERQHETFKALEAVAAS